MVSIKEMLIGDLKEKTEQKFDIENDFPYLAAISSSDHMPK
jgi:hypothetical protein